MKGSTDFWVKWLVGDIEVDQDVKKMLFQE